MITTAVATLKETNGSSRQAIARYIDRFYSDLPHTHSSLLSHHLKRLKNTGQLVMVKHSYKLPGSLTQKHPLPEIKENGALTTCSKKRPGRPPKLKPETQLQPDSQHQLEFQQQPLFNFQPEPISQFQVHDQDQLQFPQEEAQFEGQPFVVPDSHEVPRMEPESVFASLGLLDAPPPPATIDTAVTKRRPGRPKKTDSENKSPAQLTSVKRGRGRPRKPGLTTPSGGSGRPRGRPKRNTNISSLQGPQPAAAVAMKPPSRPRGRPAKNSAHQFGSVVGGSVINVPIANSNDTAARAETPLPVVGSSNGVLLPMPKRRGRPPRLSTQPAAWNSGCGHGMAPQAPRPRGRPPRSSYNGGVYKKPRKLSGKPLGRPKKNAPLIAPIASYSHHLALEGHLEQLKSRIKETASFIRPFLNHETAVTALHDLEAFAEGVKPVQPA
ncbi:unnamed protein product [Cuscuta epithymum]|uniref:H15 domain-containing protein n=1 Tax=Cuscuta epithymum TaxID=186058 RepID=A0AAV0G7M7_9ASTE|nr:unnamed protein product [Cuscuta epithymum]